MAVTKVNSSGVDFSSSTDIAFDTNTLYVDATNNRVGIGTSSPVHPLTITASGATSTFTVNPSSNLTVIGTAQSSATNSNLYIDTKGTGYIIFRQAAGTSEIMRMDGEGLKFNGDTAAANALDDYEEGTFTMTLSGATTTTYTTNSGTYTKIGDIVYVRGILHINSYGDGNGAKIDGFPFTSNGESAFSIAKISAIQTAVVDITFRISGTSGYFMHRTAASTGETTNPSQMAASGAYLLFAGTYKAS